MQGPACHYAQDVANGSQSDTGTAQEGDGRADDERADDEAAGDNT
jgi:hypothetical protein